MNYHNLKNLVTLAGLIVLAVAAFSAIAPCQERPDPYRGNPALLEPTGRDAWQMPERVMDLIGVRKGMIIGEVGAGGGYFTVKLAERVGEYGHVYANEINKRFLQHIEERCETLGITNVTTILGEESDPLLPEGKLDMVIMVNVLHEVSRPVPLLRTILPSLKEGATLVIIDYDKKKRRSNHTYIPEMAIEEARMAGYALIRREDFLPRQFLLVLKPREY